MISGGIHMGEIGTIKHVFPGGNTTKGFYSFYHYILPQTEANHIFVIKGGPGVGKSSFMKKLSEKFVALGYDVEHHHCSSDNNSLDGLVISKLKVALLDGTAPHIVDPIHPGAVDEILHLGDFWNEAGIKEHKQEILKLNGEIGRLFKKAYQYLYAANDIYKTWSDTQKMAFDTYKATKKTNELIDTIFKDVNPMDQLGRERHLFGTAITPTGFEDHIHTIIGTSQSVYMIKDAPGASARDCMQKIYTTAVEKGLYVECYHSPITVDKIEDIIIPSLNTAVSVVNDYHKAKVLPTN
jgi:predicted ATPase